MSKHLSGYICVVTGATRGLGKAIAIALGESGATVYITGRTLDPPGQALGKDSECLRETARLIDSLGGKAIPVAVDHSDDNQVAGLFTRIRREQSGRLDVLVNNAFSAADYLLSEAGPDSVYWEPSNAVRSPSEEWDLVNRVGLRNAYTCCVLATRIMVECRSRADTNNIHAAVGLAKKRGGPIATGLPTGVIVNISSLGGTRRIFNVAFCAGKSALDRMTLEMAADLRKRNIDVAVVSLLPGLVRTEQVVAALESGTAPAFLTRAISVGIDVPPEIPGKVIAALVGQSPQALAKQSGRCLVGAELAHQFGLRVSDRTYPKNPRAFKTILQLAGWNRMAVFVPAFVKIPYWVLAIVTSKF
ncbi:dehydrogenase/reductase SDR family member 1 [Paragonimus westermani]|uniref:Dehydrogenase/reductase SDR family member 1 n=1 Tax=Paragonimus westermani TaxID=34504 RepID=A0A5J4NAA5_9TREM|nr:dehydrogenase/reductase SDR family member 1 [Paragonimus westermani]